MRIQQRDSTELGAPQSLRKLRGGSMHASVTIETEFNMTGHSTPVSAAVTRAAMKMDFRYLDRTIIGSQSQGMPECRLVWSLTIADLGMARAPREQPLHPGEQSRQVLAHKDHTSWCARAAHQRGTRWIGGLSIPAPGPVPSELLSRTL